MRLRLRGIALAYAVAFIAINVFRDLLAPTLARIFTISLTFFARISPFFAQARLVDSSVFGLPKLKNRVLDLNPFAGAQTYNPCQLFVVQRKAAIVLAPCCDHEKQVRAMFLCGEVPRVGEIVAAEQG